MATPETVHKLFKAAFNAQDWPLIARCCIPNTPSWEATANSRQVALT